MRRVVASVVLLAALLAALPAHADLQSGLAAYQAGEFANALELLRPVADLGNATAQHHIGVIFSTGGRGVEINLQEALRYYALAAGQGHAESQDALGFIYAVGNGVRRDEAEAAKWYRLAADQGVGRSQMALGGMYGMGRGVPQDYVQAYKWFSLANMHEIDDARLALFLTADKMTEKQIREAQQLAARWTPQRGLPQ